MIHRIIGRLDIKGPNLVKGVHLEGLRVLGKPEDFARNYYKEGIDELIYIDVIASLIGRNSLHEIISKTAEEVFIPLTVGGGIRTIEDIRGVLRAGADKVSLNTAAIKNPEIIRNASKIFGSSTITVSIEAMRQSDGTYLAFTDNGREYTGIEVLPWAKKVESLGAGEILLTSINKDGTGKGFDIGLVKMVASSVSIPVIASGGAGKPSDVVEVLKSGLADAVAIGTLLHYNYLQSNNVSRDFSEEGNREFLKSGLNFSRVTKTDIKAIKKELVKKGISCRV